MIPAGYIHQGNVDALIKNALNSLSPEVTHVSYRIRPDSTDEPSIFFRIVLADAYIDEDTIADLTGRISRILLDAVGPVDNWGLRPYFNYRSKSEQDRRPDPDWV